MLSFVMLAFTGFYALFAQQQVQVMEEQRATFAEAVADKVAFELDLALSEGPGFARNFTLPGRIGTVPYAVNVSTRTVVVRWRDRRAVARTAATSIDGNVTPGDNRVENVGGDLRVD